MIHARDATSETLCLLFSSEAAGYTLMFDRTGPLNLEAEPLRSYVARLQWSPVAKSGSR